MPCHAMPRLEQGLMIKINLAEQYSLLDRFDGVDLQSDRKVKSQWMLEALFVFKTGIEVREVLENKILSRPSGLKLRAKQSSFS
jgi:hypothetical protein